MDKDNSKRQEMVMLYFCNLKKSVSHKSHISH